MTPGPAVPSTGALAPLDLDDVRLDPTGLLGSWQERNAAATLPHCIEQLDSHGNVDNLRRAAEQPRDSGERPGEFVGLWFADSDVYKTMEAAAWQLGWTEAPALQRFLEATTGVLARAQDDDGYLNSYFQTDHRDKQWRELRWSHEMYCAGHLIQAAVAAARAGAAPELVALARRFADLLVERFGPDGVEGIDGHPVIETALVELYRVTGEQPYLALAKRFVDLRGRGLLGEDRSMGRPYYQDHQPVRKAGEVTGHVVRQLYLLSGVVDVAVETGDQELLDAAERLWDSAFLTKTYLTGGHGSRHRDEAFGDPYELPPDRAYVESCAAIASCQWQWRMLLATGRRRYADEMERVLYNAIAGAIAEDGRHFFYSNPLQLRTGHDGSHEDAPSGRLPWYTCPCCPPNLARLMASLHGYVATSTPDGLQLHLYTPGRVGEVTVLTEYPWNNHIAITVQRGGTWELALRIPGWCSSYSVSMEHENVDGYARIRREWTPGDTVVLELALDARRVTAHPHVDAVRGCVALMRGPLVYCVEHVDLPPDVVLEDVRLNPSAPLAVDGRTLRTTGRVIDSTSTPLYGADGETFRGGEVAVTAVPYFTWGNRGGGPMRIWIPVST